MTAHNPMEKERATEKKQEKINQSEMSKQAAIHNNEAAHQHKVQGSTGVVHYTASGETASSSINGLPGQSTGMHQMSAMPGHGIGQPMTQVTEGTMGTHPIGVKRRGAVGNTTGGTTTHNTRVEGHAPSYGTGGGTYSSLS